MSGWETRIQTGNPYADQATLQQHQQAAAAQGMTLQVQPLPGGGYHVRAVPGQMGGAQPGYGGYGGQPAMQYGAAAMAAPGGVVVGGPNAGYAGSGVVAAPLSEERIKYIRKVYLLLATAVFVAVAGAMVTMTIGGNVAWTPPGTHLRLMVPAVVRMMFDNPALEFAAYGALLVSVLIASAVTRVKGLNVIMLYLCAALMGLELAPLVIEASLRGGLGIAMVVNPVRDTFILVGALFAGATAYVLIARKDFSYLGSMLSMGAGVVFFACFVAIFLQSEVFSLAIASVGALVSGGFLLWRTSRILNGPMNDAVGDALGFLITLRNLFMFILRILMSSRR